MTNQQAIEQLKSLKDFFKSEKIFFESDKEAVAFAIAALEGQNEKKEEWPKMNDIYFYASDEGDVYCSYFLGIGVSRLRAEYTGIFRTKERAELKRDVIKVLANAKPWVPKNKLQSFYYFEQGYGICLARWCEENRYKGHKQLVAQGNCFPATDEGRKRCEEYGALMMREAEQIISENS